MRAVINKPSLIFLFEDDPNDEALTMRAIRDCHRNLRVLIARNGEDAMRLMGLDSAPYEDVPDLIISDLKLLKLHGDELLQKARQDSRLRDTVYVIFSSSSEKSDIRRCLDSGADGYFIKPVEYTEYIAQIHEILDVCLEQESVLDAEFSSERIAAAC